METVLVRWDGDLERFLGSRVLPRHIGLRLDLGFLSPDSLKRRYLPFTAILASALFHWRQMQWNQMVETSPVAEEDSRELGAPAKELRLLRNPWEAEERKGFLVPLKVIMLGNNKITVLCAILCTLCFIF